MEGINQSFLDCTGKKPHGGSKNPPVKVMVTAATPNLANILDNFALKKSNYSIVLAFEQTLNGVKRKGRFLAVIDVLPINDECPTLKITGLNSKEILVPPLKEDKVFDLVVSYGKNSKRSTDDITYFVSSVKR